MAFWKYAKKKPGFSYDTFLRLPDNQKFKIYISSFEIIKKEVDESMKTVFQSDVYKVNDEKVDKLWTIFNYDNVMYLKKKLGKSGKKVILEVVRRMNEDTMEDYYEIEIIEEKDDDKKKP